MRIIVRFIQSIYDSYIIQFIFNIYSRLSCIINCQDNVEKETLLYKDFNSVSTQTNSDYGLDYISDDFSEILNEKWTCIDHSYEINL